MSSYPRDELQIFQSIYACGPKNTKCSKISDMQMEIKKSHWETNGKFSVKKLWEINGPGDPSVNGASSAPSCVWVGAILAFLFWVALVFSNPLGLGLLILCLVQMGSFRPCKWRWRRGRRRATRTRWPLHLPSNYRENDRNPRRRRRREKKKLEEEDENRKGKWNSGRCKCMSGFLWFYGEWV